MGVRWQTPPPHAPVRPEDLVEFQGTLVAWLRNQELPAQAFSFITGPGVDPGTGLAVQDEHIARWDGTTGLLLQDSEVLLGDAGHMIMGVSGLENGLFYAIKNAAGLNNGIITTQPENIDLLMTEGNDWQGQIGMFWVGTEPDPGNRATRWHHAGNTAIEGKITGDRGDMGFGAGFLGTPSLFIHTGADGTDTGWKGFGRITGFLFTGLPDDDRIVPFRSRAAALEGTSITDGLADTRDFVSPTGTVKLAYTIPGDRAATAISFDTKEIFDGNVTLDADASLTNQLVPGCTVNSRIYASAVTPEAILEPETSIFTMSADDTIGDTDVVDFDTVNAATVAGQDLWVAGAGLGEMQVKFAGISLISASLAGISVTKEALDWTVRKTTGNNTSPPFTPTDSDQGVRGTVSWAGGTGSNAFAITGNPVAQALVVHDIDDVFVIIGRVSTIPGAIATGVWTFTADHSIVAIETVAVGILGTTPFTGVYFEPTATAGGTVVIHHEFTPLTTRTFSMMVTEG